ncbi:MAG: chromate transporter, partial [Prevotellaceae bacterium]|nr:chromate transporter [Prevotellaceae bacterium]
MKIYFDIFFTFLKIGAFTLGGGYAMIPLVEREVVDRKKWIARHDFLDLLAVTQAMPGVIAINMAVFVGYKI